MEYNFTFMKTNDKEIQLLKRTSFYHLKFHTIAFTTLRSTVLRNSVQVRSLQKEMDEQEQHMTNRIRKLEQTIKWVNHWVSPDFM